MLLVIISLLGFVKTQWQLIDPLLITSTDTPLKNWTFQNSDNDTCIQNQEKNIIIGINGFVSKSFSIKVQAIQIILDVYYDFPNSEDQGTQSEINIKLTTLSSEVIIYNKPINRATLSSLNQICNQESVYPFQPETIIITPKQIQQQNFSLNISFDNTSQDFGNKLRIRNLNIYGFFCSPVCKSCVIDNPTACLSCFFELNGNCICKYPSKFTLQNGGCAQECPRDSYLSRVADKCLIDQRIESQYYFLNTTESLGSSLTPITAIINPLDTSFSELYGTSKISFQLGYFNQNITFLRIRFTLYLGSFSVNSFIKSGLNDVDQSQIHYNGTHYLLSSVVDHDILVPGFLYLISTDLPILIQNYTKFRLELLFFNSNSNPILFIEGSQCDWAFSNLTVDVGVCQQNCILCASTKICQQCADGYKFYDQACVYQCPSYSQQNATHCVDYSKIILYSIYLVKAFYDNTMPINEIQSHYDQVNNESINFLTGQKFSFLSNKIVLGGPLVWNNAQYQKIYQITNNPHYNVSLRFNLTFGQQFSGTFRYSIDSNWRPIINNQVTTSPSVQHIFENFQHNDTQLQIIFECQSNNPLTDGFCAISEYFILVHYCPQSYFCKTCNLYYNCTSCIFQPGNKYFLRKGNCMCYSSFNRIQVNNKCQCQTGYTDDLNNYFCQPICGDQLVVQGEDCDDGNFYPYDGCHQCKFTCQIECQLCVSGKCLKCQEGFQMVQEFCYPACRENLAVYPCAQDSGEIQYSTFLIPVQDCWDCFYSCPEHCKYCIKGECLECEVEWNLFQNYCFPICGNTILQNHEECENSTPDVVVNGCLYCQCVYGFHSLFGQCYGTCGDGIFVSSEECDDGNLVSFDGCSSTCKLECINCLNCVGGICQKCSSGYYFDSNQICNKTICGDNIRVKDEECDDGNLVINDGCSDCQCELGWKANKNGCKSTCGDGLMVKGEQCDDGNNDQYDGCYNCKYDCNKECSQCELGNCLKCNYGFNLINNNCINTCGDGILNLNTEQCDDKNTFPRDGCFNCKLEQGFICFNDNLMFKSCQRCSDTNCINCILDNSIEICQNCQSGYYLNEKQECLQCDPICIDCIKTGKNCINYNYNNYQVKECNNNKGLYYNFELRDCKPECGDGIIQGDEQCDDKNINNFDGCNSQCQIEKGYLLDIETNQILAIPNIETQQLKNDKYNQNIYLIKDYSNEPVINCSATIIVIENFTEFNYTVGQNNSNCELTIQYFQTILPINVIHLYIQHQTQYKGRVLTDQDNFLLEIKVEPQKQVFVSEEKQVQAKSVATTSKAVSSSLMALGPLAILVGGFKFIWFILDLLSWLNNFYYLNVNYPANVQQLFLQADWSNVIQIPQINYLNTPSNIYYFKAPQKFNDKGVDPLFLNNIQTVIFFFLQVFITKLLCKGFIHLINYLYKTSTTIHKRPQIFRLGTIFKRTITNQKDEPPTIQIAIPKLLQATYKKCEEFDQYFVASLLKTLQINFLDLTLATMLQLSNQQTISHPLVRINVFFAYVTLIILFFILNFSYYISCTHQQLLENKAFKTHYGCFYEDVKVNSKIAMLYSSINLLRKAAFIVSTVYFYEKPIYQTSFCFLSCILNIIILASNNPFETKQQYVLNIIPDISVLIVTGITILFAFQDTFNLIQDETIEGLGWIIVICIYSSIGIQLLFLIKQFLTDLYEQFKRFKEYFIRVK